MNFYIISLYFTLPLRANMSPCQIHTWCRVCINSNIANKIGDIIISNYSTILELMDITNFESRHILTGHSFIQVRHFRFIGHNSSNVQVHPVFVADKLLQSEQELPQSVTDSEHNTRTPTISHWQWTQHKNSYNQSLTVNTTQELPQSVTDSEHSTRTPTISHWQWTQHKNSHNQSLTVNTTQELLQSVIDSEHNTRTPTISHRQWTQHKNSYNQSLTVNTTQELPQSVTDSEHNTRTPTISHWQWTQHKNSYNQSLTVNTAQ